jgi:hypothetical protein
MVDREILGWPAYSGRTLLFHSPENIFVVVSLLIERLHGNSELLKL